MGSFCQKPQDREKDFLRISLRLSCLCRLTKSDARAAAIFIDELDAGSFKGAAHHSKCSSPRQMALSLELADRHDSYPCAFSEHLLAPIKETARCSALLWSDRHLTPAISSVMSQID